MTLSTIQARPITEEELADNHVPNSNPYLPDLAKYQTSSVVEWVWYLATFE